VIAEWENPWWLETPEGTLYFNETDSAGHHYQLVPDRCSATLPVRTTEDDAPQSDGKIPHRRWRSGYGVHLAIEPMVESGGELDCAGGSDLVAMLDELGLHLNAMIRTGLVSGFPNARLFFTPTGYADRMFDRMQLASAPAVTLDGALGGMLVEVDMDTPYPYYIASEEDDTAVSESGNETITNDGNTDYFPVVEVYGPTSAFALINYSIEDTDGNPLQIVYSSSLPGGAAIAGGDYLEITFFDGKAYLNGTGANRKAGIDFRYSDFFPIVPGENDIQVTGASALFKTNSAWA
jgi:hypothetical protein